MSAESAYLVNQERADELSLYLTNNGMMRDLSDQLLARAETEIERVAAWAYAIRVALKFYPAADKFTSADIIQAIQDLECHRRLKEGKRNG